MSDEINIKTKAKKTKLLIIIAVVVIALLTVGAVLFTTSKNATAKKVEKQLSLGEKYLSELDYEQAIVAYELAIEIDPKNAEAYIGLADVYVAMGDYEKAEEILEEAKDKVTNEKDIEKIEKKQIHLSGERGEEKADAVPTATVLPMPEPTVTPMPRQPENKKISFTGEIKALDEAGVGDSVLFGSYEQDNDLSNGTEPIEWLVLDKKDGRALVLSKYAIEFKAYNDDWIDVTWESCTLRKWLNGEFYQKAFGTEEQSAVVETFLLNEDNPNSGNKGGNDTYDRVFLLSAEEVIYYFDIDASGRDLNLQAKVTEYVKALGGGFDEDAESVYYGNGTWWLRSPGEITRTAAVVSHGGIVDRYGINVNDYFYDIVVRPALWVIY